MSFLFFYEDGFKREVVAKNMVSAIIAAKMYEKNRSIKGWIELPKAGRPLCAGAKVIQPKTRLEKFANLD